MTQTIIEEMDGIIGKAIASKPKSDDLALEILDLAINIETLTQEHYYHLAKNVANPSGKSVFDYMGDEAGRELEILKTQHEALKEDKKWLDREYKGVSLICPVIAPKRKADSADDVLPEDSDITRDETDLEALKLAIEVKKRLIKFYCEASSKVGSAGKKMFSILIETEEKHLEELSVQLQWLEQTGFWYDPDMMMD